MLEHLPKSLKHVNEVVQITGLPTLLNNENDHLYFDVYVNGTFHGEGKYPLRVYNQIQDTELANKKPKKIELFSKSSTAPVGVVEVTLEYVGKNYNVDTYVELVLDWRSVYGKNIVENDKNLIIVLDKVRKTGIQTVVKFFPELMSNLFDIYLLACQKHEILTASGAEQENKFKRLAQTAFECIVHLLDMVIARQDSYIYLFDQLLETSIPKIGNYLLSDLTGYLGQFETLWNSTCRAICRVSVLVNSIAVISISDDKTFFGSVVQLADTMTRFLSSTNESFVSDQLVLIDSLEVILESLRGTCNDYQLTKIIADWCGAIGLKGQ
ncbi:unnamed protein product [Ambrosiozyma monospora]|uniref:Unnamed protein product n=1 Tax=Ambrosiozyma monospora TaxID=43982 RepID=A0ACB5TP54_AMBMO|nr:unnamed protein product [Ambrosiozyma monospora]